MYPEVHESRDNQSKETRVDIPDMAVVSEDVEQTSSDWDREDITNAKLQLLLDVVSDVYLRDETLDTKQDTKSLVSECCLRFFGSVLESAG